MVQCCVERMATSAAFLRRSLGAVENERDARKSTTPALARNEVEIVRDAASVEPLASARPAPVIISKGEWHTIQYYAEQS